MTRARLFAIAAGALIIALGVGYVWGSSGRFDAEHALDQTRQQLDLAEARGELLDARVSLYNLNFGEAVTHFEDTNLQSSHDYVYRVRAFNSQGNGNASGSVEVITPQLSTITGASGDDIFISFATATCCRYITTPRRWVGRRIPAHLPR